MATPPFEDARRKRGKGGGGRFITTGDRLRNVARHAGQKPEVEAKFGRVGVLAHTSKVLGADVRGFSHSISSDAIRHMQRRHPNLTDADFGRLPAIVRSRPRLGKDTGPNGEPRLIYEATVGGVKYGYVAEYRRRKRRLAAVTLYRR